ncbi:MAG TPA: CHAD domain-containing protein [Terracidiphilus sp.]|nr:CHAD domain-containing protein [Terracidiphilus sp.]
MNSGTFPEEGRSDPGVHVEFRRQLQAWRHLLAHCGRKPGRKYVHDLRVATLRVQAALEYWLGQEEAGETSAAGGARRWRRQGKKLRRALGPVRQADVSLSKLERVRSWADPAADGAAVFPRECLGAIEKIVNAVKRKREVAAKQLTAEIKQRRKRLNRLTRKLEAALEMSVAPAEAAVSDKIQAQIAAAAARFPALDSENLHEFRKRVKKIRYLAEAFAPVDPAAARQAALLKRMTGAIGEWHDWQALTEEAAHADRGNAAMGAAAQFLQAQAGRSYAHAQMLCSRSMARLRKIAMDGHAPGTAPSQNLAAEVPRKPVASVSPADHRIRTERSLHAS